MMMLTSTLAVASVMRSPLAMQRGSLRARALMSGAYDFRARDLTSGSDVELSDYSGKVALVVNLASK